MAIKNSKRLIIDTSILFSAGYKDAGDSKTCRDTLETVISVCHRAVLTSEINEEWTKHGKSGFTQSWLTRMRRRNKLYETKAQNDELRNKIEVLDLDEEKKQVMLKDVHLIEAALIADKTVLSLDEEARILFCSFSKEIEELQDIVWVNPIKLDETCIAWLNKGARPDKVRRLPKYIAK